MPLTCPPAASFRGGKTEKEWGQEGGGGKTEAGGGKREGGGVVELSLRQGVLRHGYRAVARNHFRQRLCHALTHYNKLDSNVEKRRRGGTQADLTCSGRSGAGI